MVSCLKALVIDFTPANASIEVSACSKKELKGH